MFSGCVCVCVCIIIGSHVLVCFCVKNVFFSGVDSFFFEELST